MKSDRIKIKYLSIIGFTILMAGFLISGATVYYFVEKHMQIKEKMELYGAAHSALLALSEHTEKLKTTNRLVELHPLWKNSMTVFQKALDDLYQELPTHEQKSFSSLLKLSDNIQTESEKIDKLLQSPLHTDVKKTLDEPLLKRFGALSALQDNSYVYFELNAIINALEHLTSLEESGLNQLAHIIQTTQKLEDEKLSDIRQMSLIFPSIILLVSFLVAAAIFAWMSRSERDLHTAYQELNALNQHLQEEVEKKLQEIRERDEMLIQQSKQAALGEMISNIAHQWRQPITSIGLSIQTLEDVYESQELDQKYIESFIDANMKQIQFLSQTINDFKSFFAPDKQKTHFDVTQTIEATRKLVEPEMQHQNITLQIEAESLSIHNYENELRQILLTLIKNAQDAILSTRHEKQIDKQGTISIQAGQNNDQLVLSIKDNGGGIAPNIIDRIFEPYFTTKFKSQGTGIGLYMARTILEKHMEGKIRAQNEGNGAKFTLTLPLHQPTT